MRLQVCLVVHFLSYELAKQEDDELVLQIVYVFHQLVQHDATRIPVVKESRILT